MEINFGFFNRLSNLCSYLKARVNLALNSLLKCSAVADEKAEGGFSLPKSISYHCGRFKIKTNKRSTKKTH
jgi:hypothetical protein